MMFPDYGRNIVKLVEAVKGIEDRAERTAAAEQVVTIMGQINPKAKDTGNWRLKVWEHLMLMSNWELDVDVPEGVQKEASTEFRPKPVNYPDGKIVFKHYGHFLEEMISVVKEMPEGEERDELIREIAAQMKRMYLVWNRDTVNDELIRIQLERLSDGQIALPEDFSFEETRKILADLKADEIAKKQQKPQQKQKSKKKKK